MKLEDWTIEYTPLYRSHQGGNEIQVVKFDFPNNTEVIERTYFPWNIFKNPTTWWCVDLVLPMSFEPLVKEFGGILTDKYYTADGYGMPEFTDLEQAFNFHQQYLNNLKS